MKSFQLRSSVECLEHGGGPGHVQVTKCSLQRYLPLFLHAFQRVLNDKWLQRVSVHDIQSNQEGNIFSHELDMNWERLAWCRKNDSHLSYGLCRICTEA